jgi:hypothetical protein
MSSLHKEQNIVLFESSTNLKNIEKFISKNDSIIITFDYKSHELLTLRKVSHKVSDSFLDEKDIHFLQKETYRLTKWFKTKVSDSITYDNINLGELFYIDFYFILLPIMKKFFEVMRIIKKHPNAKFFASSGHYEIIKQFSQSVISLGGKKLSTKFYLDVISNRFEIGGKFFTINLSKKRYNSLKKLSEKIMIKKIQKMNPSKKTILFTEFDPLRYSKIFSPELRDTSNILLYNRRRPTIWNLQSLSILKKSGCGIILEDNLMDKTLSSSIKKNSELTENFIQSLLDHEDFLESFFSINEISFWSSIRSSFIQLCKIRFKNALAEIMLAKKLFEKFTPSAVIVLSEMGFQEQILIQVAKKFQTSVILLQHGINFDDKAAFEANQFLGVIPNHSDKIAVWGQVDKKYLEECKIPLKKIQIIGNPYFDKLFEENNQTLAENKGFVLLAAQSPNVGSFVIDAEIKTMEKYLEAIRTICKTVLKTDKELVIKLHPDPSELDITRFVKKIDPKIQVIKAGSISDLIRSCDTLVTIDISTVTLEAQIFEKPVISVSVKNYNIGDDNCSFFKSKSCIRTELQNFDMNFNRLLQDQEFKHETINRGKKYVNDCLSNQGNASRKLLEFSTKINLEN